MKTTAFALSALLAAPLAAKPFKHAALHAKRDYTQTVTVINDVTVTVDVFVTVTDDAANTAGGAQITPVINAQQRYAADPTPNSAFFVPSITPAVQSAGSNEEHQAQMLAYQQSQIDQQSAANAAQEAANASHAAQMLQMQSSTSTTAPAAAPASPAPEASPVVQKAYAQPAAGSGSGSGSGSSSSGPSGGACGTVGGKCTASDVTTFDSGSSGKGACGWVNIEKSQHYFALAQATFGSYTNDLPGDHKNAYCGRTVAIQGSNGQTVEAVLTDTCPECQGYSLDLSPALWSAVFPGQSPSRNHDITWWFTSEATYSGPP